MLIDSRRFGLLVGVAALVSLAVCGCGRNQQGLQQAQGAKSGNGLAQPGAPKYPPYMRLGADGKPVPKGAP